MGILEYFKKRDSVEANADQASEPEARQFKKKKNQEPTGPTSAKIEKRKLMQELNELEQKRFQKSAELDRFVKQLGIIKDTIPKDRNIIRNIENKIYELDSEILLKRAKINALIQSITKKEESK